MSENWDFYIFGEAEQTESRFVDLGIHDQAPIPGQSRLVTLKLELLAPHDGGLAGEQEYQQLTRIEDTLAVALRERHATCSYVGRRISGRHCEFFVYAMDGQIVEALLTEAMSPFSDYTFTTGGRDDSGWETYLNTLYPDDHNLQIIRNGRSLRHLTEQGDNHQIPRPVLHHALFASGSDRKRFISAVAARGFTPQQEDRIETQQGFEYRACVARTQTLEFDAINATVSELLDISKDCGGNYKGWETSVVTSRG